MNSASPHDVFGFLEELVGEHELDMILARPAEEVRAELIADGVDLDRVRMMLDHALGEGEAPPARRPRAKVIPIKKAQPGRVIPVMRTVSVAIAASFFGIFVWRESTMSVVPGRAQRPELSDVRPAPAPSMVDTDLQKAALLRVQASRLCNQGYWDECEDKLDEAGRLDGPGNDTLVVNELRNRIGVSKDEDTNGGVPAYAKPGVGPSEVPLRRRPH